MACPIPASIPPYSSRVRRPPLKTRLQSSAARRGYQACSSSASMMGSPRSPVGSKGEKRTGRVIGASPSGFLFFTNSVGRRASGSLAQRVVLANDAACKPRRLMSRSLAEECAALAATPWPAYQRTPHSLLVVELKPPAAPRRLALAHGHLCQTRHGVQTLRRPHHSAVALDVPVDICKLARIPRKAALRHLKPCSVRPQRPRAAPVTADHADNCFCSCPSAGVILSNLINPQNPRATKTQSLTNH